MTISERLAGLKEKPGEFVDNAAAQVRMQYLDRWMERTREIGKECTSPSQIDYSDPQISLEWKFCDPATIVAYQSKRLRPNVIKTLTPEELEYLHSDPKALRAFEKEKLKQILRRNR